MRKKPAATNPGTVSVDLHIETDSYVPYYQQVVDQVRAHIKSGALREGEVFNSEGEVAAALGISKMPVRQAFQKLRAEGLLTVTKGRRPVIGSSQVPWNFQQLRGFSEEMRRRGLVPSATVRGLKRVAPQDVEKFLGLFSEARSRKVFCVLFRRMGKDEPPTHQSNSPSKVEMGAASPSWIDSRIPGMLSR